MDMPHIRPPSTTYPTQHSVYCEYMSRHVAIHMPMHECIHMPTHMATHMHMHMSIHISMRMSVHMSAHMPMDMSTHMPIEHIFDVFTDSSGRRHADTRRN